MSIFEHIVCFYSSPCWLPSLIFTGLCCLFFIMRNSLFGHVGCLYIYSSPCDWRAIFTGPCCLFFTMQNSLFGHVDCLYIYSSPCWLTSQYSLYHVSVFCKECKVIYSDTWAVFTFIPVHVDWRVQYSLDHVVCFFARNAKADKASVCKANP